MSDFYEILEGRSTVEFTLWGFDIYRKSRGIAGFFTEFFRVGGELPKIFEIGGGTFLLPLATYSQNFRWV